MLNFFKSIPQIFYSRTFYADLIRRGRGIGITYMLLGIFLSLIVPTVELFTLPRGLGLKVESVFARLPEMTFKNSKLSIDQTSPYVVTITTDATTPNALVFDTSPRTDDVSQIEDTLTKQKMIALITSDFVATRKNKATIEIYNFRDYGDQLKDYQITHEQWADLGNKIVAWAIPVSFVVILFFSALGALIMTFIQALIAKLIALFFTYRPDLSAAMRLAAVAAIPGGFLHCLVAAINAATHAKPLYTVPFSIGVVIWLAVVVGGLYAADQDAKQSAAAQSDKAA